MRKVPKGLLASFCATVAVVGCSERELRPLTPCTTAGVSQRVDIDDIKNVDLLFMIDNSNSMNEEQNKLRAEFPRMVRALVTGDIDGPGPLPAGPAVESLRVGVVTSDMGIGGIGTMPGQLVVGSCLGQGNAAQQYARSHYGDDGILRRQTTTVTEDSTNPTTPVAVDCNFDGVGGDDLIAASALPDFLTFNAAATPAQDLDAYVDRVNCITNVGITGCGFEQQLEAVLKAVTPAASTGTLLGGPFHAAPGEEATRSLGHGDDPATNGGWFRDDSLLAIVMVTDEDDCSAHDPLVFDSNTTQQPYVDQYGVLQAQTRCERFESAFVHDTNRYVRGLRALRAGRERLLVFAAITGVPEDLTDGDDEGSTNLQAILDDPRMAYTRETTTRLYMGTPTQIPDGALRPACTHRSVPDTFGATGDLTSGSAVINNVTIVTPAAGRGPSFTGDGIATANAGKDTIVMTAIPGFTPTEGMTVSGPNIAPGTVVVSVTPVAPGPYNLTLSAELTGTPPGTAETFTFNAGFGPGLSMEVTGTGVPQLASIADITGTGPYTVTLSAPVTVTATGAALTIGILDVSAVPSRRAIRVARDLGAATGLPDNTIVQSICVDSFAPAMERILLQIQRNLAGSCLPRPLIRGATDQVNCDVFVTLPPNVSCDDASFNEAYLFLENVPAGTGVGDTDGVLERCVVAQLPVPAMTVSAGTAPTGDGWYYNNYHADIDECSQGPQRISFAGAGQPPQGSQMAFGCAQPVQDGELEIDVAAACNNVIGSDACLFSSVEARDDFVLRYNLPASFDANVAGAGGADGDFICEEDTQTCQIRCDTNADCPGGFVCYDDPADTDADQGRGQRICVNPTCGAD